jgi:putative glutamine amidotransferase
MVRVDVSEVLPEREPQPGGPTIAVLVALNFPDLTEHVAALVRRFTRTALETLVDVGATPWLVDLTGGDLPSVDEVMAADGVLLLGGGDMDASLYGHSGPVPNEYGVDRAVDDYSIAAVLAALDADRPLLGICRGAQVLNVALGGSLVPDIEDHELHRGDGGDAVFLDETVRLEPGSRLHALVGQERLVVRSGHHQAVKEPGRGLRVVGRAEDGLVEAVEHERRWAIGMQWHPEDSHGSYEDRHRVFGGFVQEVAARRG